MSTRTQCEAVTRRVVTEQGQGRRAPGARGEGAVGSRPTEGVGA